MNAPLATADSIAEAQRCNDTLFYLNVTGLATTTTLQTDLPKRPWFVRDFRSLTQNEVKGRFIIEVDPKTTLNRLKFQGKNGLPR